jgi:hypothetical protein
VLIGKLETLKHAAPVEDVNENNLVVKKPQKHAAGLEAVVLALDRGIAQAPNCPQAERSVGGSYHLARV